MGVVGHARPEKTKLLTSQLLTEPPGRGSPKDVTDAALVRNPSGDQWRRAVYTSWVTRSESWGGVPYKPPPTFPYRR